MMEDNRNAWQEWVLKDNHSEGQHHDIEDILSKGNGYFVEVGDINEERHLGRDVGQPCPGHVGKDAKTFGGQS